MPTLESQQECYAQSIVFQTKCLRRICNIFWPNKISNEDLYRRTNSLPISCQIYKHSMRWLGNVLRMSPESHTMGSTEMDTHRKNIKGLSQDYMERRSIISKLSKSNIGLTMGEDEVIAQYYKRWRMTLWHYLPHGDEEGK